MSNLNIIVDENIPQGVEAFSGFGKVITRAGRTIGPADLAEADVLMVRSVTPVNRTMLENSPVRFVGSATTGTDHVDRAYLQEAGIGFAHAPGANADSVVEYVTAALLQLARQRKEVLEGKTVGIVGCGQVGSRLARRLPALGLQVLKNDPPLAEQQAAAGKAHDYVSLDTVLQEADIITLHVPLTREGKFPTYHLIGEQELQQLGASTWLINTCRGAVVDNQALTAALKQQQIAAAALDVWENEPRPSTDLLDRCAVATPHIAGYSRDGKLGGTVMIYQALEKFLGVNGKWNYQEKLMLAPETNAVVTPPEDTAEKTAWLDAVVQQLYDIRRDDRRMRRILELADDEQGRYFVEMRRTYPVRRAFKHFSVARAHVPRQYRQAVTDGLQLQLIE